MMEKKWRIILGILTLSIGAFIALLMYANFKWTTQDYRSDARGVIFRQLAAAHPGYKPNLIVKMYGQDEKARDLCIYEVNRENVIVNIWSILYTRDVPAPLMHQEYTPNWTKLGGVETLCIYYAAEPPPPEWRYAFRLPPKPDLSLEGPAAQSLPPSNSTSDVVDQAGPPKPAAESARAAPVHP